MINIKILGVSSQYEESQYILIGFLDDNDNIIYQEAFYENNFKNKEDSNEEEILKQSTIIKKSLENKQKQPIANNIVNDFIKKYEGDKLNNAINQRIQNKK